MPPCPISKCCPTGCTICGYAASHLGAGVQLAHGTVTITYRNVFGGAIATSTLSYSPPQTHVCFSPGTTTYYDYQLTATSSDDASAVGYVDSSTCDVHVYGCSCSSDPLPSTLYMHVNNSSLNSSIFQPAVIRFMPRPAIFSALSIPDPGFYSVSSFVDTINPTSPFYYLLWCPSGNYSLTRVYGKDVSPPNGFRDSERYHWNIGFGGSTCSPFNLGTGTIYSGGDSSEIVSIDSTGPP